MGGRGRRCGAWLVAGLALLALPAPAPAQVGLEAPPATSPGGIKYDQLCVSCHGPGGRGAQAPNLVDPIWKHGGDDESIGRSIAKGRAPQMPAFEAVLDPQSVKDVVAYLRTSAKAVAADAGASAPEIPSAGPPKGVVRSAVHSFRVEPVAKTGVPYGFDFLPDGRILITEIGGALRIVDKGRLLPDPVKGAPTGDAASLTSHFKRGLLDVAVHPDARTNGWVYLVTSRRLTPAGAAPVTEVSVWRGRIEGDRWLDNRLVLSFPVTQINALRLAFDARRKLYLTTPWSDHDYAGTAKDAASQDLSLPIGKILRMNDDGGVPADNPFVNRPGAYPLIFSYGHREPLGIAFDAAGELWSSENGPRGGDELNHIRAGGNYGWPAISWGHRYDARPIASNPDQPGMEQPVVSWVPSPALSSVAVHSGKAFPRWKGSLFVGSLKQKTLYRIVLDGDRAALQETILTNLDRIRDVAEGPQGHLYVLTDSGDLFRLVPAR